MALALALAFSWSIVITPAIASAWWLVSNNNYDNYDFIDVEQLESTDKTVDFWSYAFLPKNDKSLKSMKRHKVIDCLNKTYFFKTIVLYSKDGSINAGPSEGIVQDIVPDTIGDAELKFVCAPASTRPNFGEQMEISPETYVSLIRATAPRSPKLDAPRRRHYQR